MSHERRQSDDGSAPARGALRRAVLACVMAAGLLAGCERPEKKGAMTEPTSKSGGESLDFDTNEAPPPPSLKELGPNGRRMKIIVLPGDASVEVDGFAARRKDGVVELTGRVGDLHRVRAFKGMHSLEQDVTIPEAQGSLRILDLYAPSPESSAALGHGTAAPDTKTPGARAPTILLSDEFE